MHKQQDNWLDDSNNFLLFMKKYEQFSPKLGLFLDFIRNHGYKFNALSSMFQILSSFLAILKLVLMSYHGILDWDPLSGSKLKTDLALES